jgi:hypothetical protein
LVTEVDVKTLQEIYPNFQDADGWGDKGTAHSYIDVYAEHLTKRFGVNFLEIGVQLGHSIAMWQDYFMESQVYGIDVTLSNVIFDNLENVYVCNATVKEQVDSCFEGKSFDYIIDDGSHLSVEQIESLEIFYPYLKDGGKYFIEDVDGDSNLQSIENYLKQNKMSYKVYDLRSIKNRFDDILIVITKEKK